MCTLQVKVAEAENEERARAARRRQAALNMEAQRAREQVQASATPQAQIMPASSCGVEQAACCPFHLRLTALCSTQQQCKGCPAVALCCLRRAPQLQAARAATQPSAHITRREAAPYRVPGRLLA